MAETTEEFDQIRERMSRPAGIEKRPAGYHVRDIPRGQFGEASKVLEEAAEFGDAIEQGCKVMALVELADMIGATQAYLDNHFPGTTIDDLCLMAALTKRSFASGTRTQRQ